jgi:uncharacterized protein (TIGR01777 family)
MMRIVIPGGTGQVGTVLARAFHAAGHEVVVLSRRPQAAPWRVVEWDGRGASVWASELEGADAVINLAGRSVNCRYTAANREAILSSRVASTRAVGAAIARSTQPPAVWLQMSTATIYSHRFDAPNDERTGILGGGERDAPDTWRFSIEVAKAWEEAAGEIPTPQTRKVLLRSAMVMSPDRGGVFDTLLGLVRLGLGGRAGSGRQYISWIHDTDFVRAVLWLLGRENVVGAVNLAAPEPLPNAEFMRALRNAWGMPIGLPAAEWMVAMGAMVMRTETELVLKSRRVVSGRLLAEGFAFQFPEWATAARDLCRRWRAART